MNEFDKRFRAQFFSAKPQRSLPCRIEAFEIAVGPRDAEKVHGEVEKLISFLIRLTRLSFGMGGTFACPACHHAKREDCEHSRPPSNHHLPPDLPYESAVQDIQHTPEQSGNKASTRPQQPSCHCHRDDDEYGHNIPLHLLQGRKCQPIGRRRSEHNRDGHPSMLTLQYLCHGYEIVPRYRPVTT